MTYEFLPLKGRSKANIEFNYATNTVKKSQSLDASRLIKQVQKQQFFESFNIKNISTPRITKVAHDYFHMEFINGKNFIQFVEDENIKNINYQIENIITYLNNIRSIPSKNELNFNSAVLKKLKQLKTEVRHPSIYKFIINELQKTNLILENTYCHGDLSLSNIIFKENQIYLIDFLDTYFNSYLLDIAKIRQDTLYYWIFKVNDYSSIKCDIVTKKINASLEKMFKNEMSSIEFKIIELINFLRIEPYTYNDKEKGLLNETIYEIFNNMSK